MLARAAPRIIASFLVLLASSAATFAIVDAAADPLAALRTRQPPVPASTVEATEARLYLDRSGPERYWLWLTGLGRTNGDIGVLRGEWGPSARDIDIGRQVAQRAGASARLLAAALAGTLACGIAFGVLGATRGRTRGAPWLRLLGYAGAALPTFWLAALVKQAAVWFNDRVGHRVLFTIGEASPGAAGMGVAGRAADAAGHLVLPTFVLAIGGVVAIGRLQRTAMIEALRGEPVRLARAKGLPERAVVRRHALRLALVPTVELGALVVSGAVSGAILVEHVFRWRGLGTFLLESVAAADTFAVMALVLVTGVLVVVANLVADLFVLLLDPRTRRGGG